MTQVQIPASPGWSGPVGRRLGGLAVARLVAQGIGFVWFVVAARVLGQAEFGRLAGGLTLVFILGALSDLGLTRTITRVVAVDPESLRSVYLGAVRRRLFSGAVLGAATLALPVDTEIVLAAGLIALASGMTELAFASLRAVGLVRLEMLLLVVERIAFVVIAGLLLAHGTSAEALLWAYLVTNLGSAVIGATVIARRGGAMRPVARADLRLLDPVGRWTAVASTLNLLAPRLVVGSALVVAPATVVASVSVSQKPAEALAALVLSIGAPLTAMIASERDADSRRRRISSSWRIAWLLTAALVPLAAVAVWWGDEPLAALVGFESGSRLGLVMGLFLLAVPLATARLVAESELLADRRARVLAAASLVSVTVIVGSAVFGVRSAVGFAVAALVAEGLALTTVCVARLTSVTPSNHPDVGAELGGDLTGDGVQPSQHGG